LRQSSAIRRGTHQPGVILAHVGFHGHPRLLGSWSKRRPSDEAADGVISGTLLGLAWYSSSPTFAYPLNADFHADFHTLGGRNIAALCGVKLVIVILC
jgi:hypothetical protein